MNDMRVLHAGFLNDSSPGFQAQMEIENEAAIANNLPWKAIAYSAQDHLTMVKRGRNDRSSLRRLSYAVSARRHYHSWLREQVKSVDVLLLRHNRCDPWEIGTIKSLKIPVVTIHHTFEVPEFKATGARMKSLLEHHVGPAALKGVAGISAVTPEILDYEQSRIGKLSKPAYVYPNGTMMLKGIPKDHRTLDVPKLLFVASSFAPWHGLDRLLGSANNSDAAFELHLVGNLSDSDRVQAKKDPRIKVHGVLRADDLTKLANACTVGLSSFGLDRMRMTQACTLKVREYLRQGLPVYAGYNDIFPREFPYFEQGIPDIDRILEYADSVRCIQRSEIVETARPLIDKRVLLQDFYDWLTQQFVK